MSLRQDLIPLALTGKKYKGKGEENDIYTIMTAGSILNAQLKLLGCCQNSWTDIVKVEALRHAGMPPILTPTTSDINMSIVNKTLSRCVCGLADGEAGRIWLGIF